MDDNQKELINEYYTKNIVPILRDYFSAFIPANATSRDLDMLNFDELIQLAMLKELRDIRRALESRR